jgi:hypothetical protein
VVVVPAGRRFAGWNRVESLEAQGWWMVEDGSRKAIAPRTPRCFLRSINRKRHRVT